MSVTATTSSDMFIGAGDVFVDGAAVGATEANNLFRVQRSYFTPKLNGIPGFIKGLDYVKEEQAELEVTIPELNLANLAYAVPGSVAIASDAAGTTLGTYNTTLAAPSVVGDTNVKVTSITTVNVGDVVQIGAIGAREFRTVLTPIGTVGAAGTGLTLNAPLSYAHASGDAIISIASTTLSADSPVGAVNVKVASVAGMVIGSEVRFGYPNEAEVRELTFVGTTGAGGTGVSFTMPLAFGHRSGDAVIVQVDAGGSTFASNSGVTRRLPSSVYHKWELVVPGLDGRSIRFRLSDAIMIDSASFEAKDDGTLAPRLKLQSRWDPAAPTVSPWMITRVPGV